MDHNEIFLVYAKQEFQFNTDNSLNEPRFLREEDISNDDVLNTKFVYSEEPSLSIKLSDLRTAPHFRPTTHKTTEAPKITTQPEETTTQTETITTEPTTEPTTNQNTKTSEKDESETNPETVLFQDMEDTKNSHKIQVNYHMKGV